VTEDLDGRLRRVVAARAGAEAEASRRRYAEDSRRQLLAVVRKKATTAFIGALSRFEQRFGDLWGHGRPASQCSPDQLARRPLYDALRQDVLTNGNNQVRAVEREFEQYDVWWHRFQTTLPARPADTQEDSRG
jgi:hypothetical protein